MNRILLLMLLAAVPAFAQERAGAILVVADDGALDASTVHALRAVTESALRSAGVALSGDARTDGVHRLDADLGRLAQDLGARRVFALRVGGHLGTRIPLSLEEVAAPAMTSVYAAQLPAERIEEADVVAGRLVRAVLARQPASSTATMTTVLPTESKPFAKRPGDRFWFVALPVALFNASQSSNPVGFEVGYGYEAENFRLGASAGAYGRGSQGVGYFALQATWIPLSTELSPYLGGGLGYMAANDTGGMGATLEAGLEAFRLHGVRAMAGVQAAVPFFSGNAPPGANRSFFPAAFLRFGF